MLSYQAWKIQRKVDQSVFPVLSRDGKLTDHIVNSRTWQKSRYRSRGPRSTNVGLRNIYFRNNLLFISFMADLGNKVVCFFKA